MLFSGCTDRDVVSLRQDLDRQAERLAALEAWQEEVNRNLSALQGLVDALRNSCYITSVVETGLGYTITLSDQRVLQIYHGMSGKDGADGGIVMPSVSIRDSSDGHAYWTVNGALLLDSGGHAVRADGEQGDTGQSGEQGIPGITPQVRINPSTNEWEISTDEGATWVSTRVKATGPQGEQGEIGEAGPEGPAGPQGIPGESIFAENGVEVREDYVEFTLADDAGTKIRVPRHRDWGLAFPHGTTVWMPRGVEKRIPFTISGSGGTPVVQVFGNGDWQGRVEMDAIRLDSGVVVVSAPDIAGSGSVLVLLNDGVGGGWTYRLDLNARPTGRMIHIPGGSLDIIGPHGVGWSLTDYWLAETEVTCQQFCDCLNDQDSVPPYATVGGILNDSTAWWWEAYPAKERVIYNDGKCWKPCLREVYYSTGNRLESMADYPMTTLTFAGTMTYCRWAGGSLPTRAQWEYAARGGDRNPNARTEIYAGSNDINEVAWYGGNCEEDGSNLIYVWVVGEKKGAHPVGTKKPNFLGFYDMTGNAKEVLKDYLGISAADGYPSNGLADHVDPQGPAPFWGDRLYCGGDFGTTQLRFLSITCVIAWSVGGSPTGLRLAYNPRE